MKVAITGATGSVGRILTRHLLRDGDIEHIVAIGHSEDRVLRYEGEFGYDPRIETRKGDVLDLRFLRRVLRDADAVYHLAAMKHVDLSEKDPYQVARVNVEGSMNVLDAVLEKEVPRCIFMSTDKVVNSSSLYGATKLVAERLFLSEANRNPRTNLNILRSGNLLLSTGSVLEVWTRSVRARNQIRLTDPAMTRFFIEDDRLGQVLLRMLDEPEGVVVIPQLEAYRLSDLAQVFIDRFAERDPEIVEIGKRPGEKIHEDLVAEDEIEKTEAVDGIYRILPEAVGDPIKTPPTSKEFTVRQERLEEIVGNHIDDLLSQVR